MQHRDDDHFCVPDVVEHTIVPDAQPIRGGMASAQPLDPAATTRSGSCPKWLSIASRIATTRRSRRIWAAARGRTAMRNMTEFCYMDSTFVNRR